jgi:hypothetical protein
MADAGVGVDVLPYEAFLQFRHLPFLFMDP